MIKKSQNEGLGTVSRVLTSLLHKEGRGLTRVQERLVPCQRGQGAETATPQASLQDSRPPQQMQPHPNKRVWGQRRPKSLGQPQSPAPLSIAAASKRPGGIEGKSAMRSWELAFLICSIRNVRTSCLCLPGWQGEGTDSQMRRCLAKAEETTEKQPPSE